eukprot:scaffold120608_cov37-Prasinocladus_malaysianus.AAC.1
MAGILGLADGIIIRSTRVLGPLDTWKALASPSGDYTRYLLLLVPAKSLHSFAHVSLLELTLSAASLVSSFGKALSIVDTLQPPTNCYWLDWGSA